MFKKPKVVIIFLMRMHTFYLVGFPLPQMASKELSRLFFGIPDAIWIDPDCLHIQIKSLGQKIDPADKIDLYQFFEQLDIAPFTVQIKGPQTFHHNQYTFITLDIAPSTEISHAKKQLDRFIKELPIKNLPAERGSFHPYIPLAKIPSTTAKLKIESFLVDYALFPFPSLQIDSIALYSTQDTHPFRFFCEQTCLLEKKCE